MRVEETNRPVRVLLFVWRIQIFEESKVPDGQKRSFCFRKTN